MRIMLSSDVEKIIDSYYNFFKNEMIINKLLENVDNTKWKQQQFNCYKHSEECPILHRTYIRDKRTRIVIIIRVNLHKNEKIFFFRNPIPMFMWLKVKQNKREFYSYAEILNIINNYTFEDIYNLVIGIKQNDI